MTYLQGIVKFDIGFPRGNTVNSIFHSTIKEFITS